MREWRKMSLSKPYFRIIRPEIRGSQCRDYEIDPRYAENRVSLCRSTNLIIKDLKVLFEYIEPCEENLKTFSHRTYELLLRAATEFETNCKAILSANGYQKLNGRLNITDYYKIENSSKLSEYSVKLYGWRNSDKILTPFIWKLSNNNHTLDWYQHYNAVKHDRFKNFSKASLINVINAVAGLVITLYSQFSIHAFSSYAPGTFFTIDDGYSTVKNSIFAIKEPASWNDDDMYGFNWNKLKNDNDPFKKFSF